LKPVERDPLAFVDWTTTEPKDIIVAKLQYTDRTGETSLVYDNPKHQWVTFPDMQPGEAVLLKVWDTVGARFALHASPQTHSYFSTTPTRELE
ncbi:MAG: methyltransferase, partial [Bacteroidota bacterium]